MGGTSLNTCRCLQPCVVVGGGANTLLGPGRAGPCGFLCLCPGDHAFVCGCSGVGVRGGGVLVCLLVPALCCCIPLWGVGVWVSGGGSWFFHSGREHLGITAWCASVRVCGRSSGWLCACVGCAVGLWCSV
jgi:hypothetical protein